MQRRNHYIYDRKFAINVANESIMRLNSITIQYIA